MTSHDTQIKDVKHVAKCLRETFAIMHIDISHSLALEACSHMAGHKDWNTYCAHLTSRSSRSTSISRLIDHLLESPKNCIDGIVSLSDHGSDPNNMWFRRYVSLVNAAVDLYFSFKNEVSEKPDPESLREIFSLAGKNSITDVFMRHEALNPEAKAVQDAKAFLITLPGFSIDHMRSGEKQHIRTYDQFSYLTMQVTKPLGVIIDDFDQERRTIMDDILKASYSETCRLADILTESLAAKSIVVHSSHARTALAGVTRRA